MELCRQPLILEHVSAYIILHNNVSTNNNTTYVQPLRDVAAGEGHGVRLECVLHQRHVTPTLTAQTAIPVVHTPLVAYSTPPQHTLAGSSDLTGRDGSGIACRRDSAISDKDGTDTLTSSRPNLCMPSNENITSMLAITDSIADATAIIAPTTAFIAPTPAFITPAPGSNVSTSPIAGNSAPTIANIAPTTDDTVSWSLPLQRTPADSVDSAPPPVTINDTITITTLQTPVANDTIPSHTISPLAEDTTSPITNDAIIIHQTPIEGTVNLLTGINAGISPTTTNPLQPGNSAVNAVNDSSVNTVVNNVNVLPSLTRPPTVKWYRNNVELVPSGVHYLQEYRRGVCRLIIPRASTGEGLQ